MRDTDQALKKLRSEIDTGTKSIQLAIENPLAASLSAGLFSALEDPSHRIIRLAEQQKKLGEKEMSYELEREKERVKRVVREFEELHPPVFEACPICLEDIRIHSTADACAMFSCCGNWLCSECLTDNFLPGKITTCPLCRETVPLDLAGFNKGLLSCVERGVAWAQFQAGGKYESGEIGGRPDMKKAVQLCLLSAEQNHPPALLHLGVLYTKGIPGLIKKSITKAMEYWQKAADLGNFHAQVNLALTLYKYEHFGVKADYPTAVKYATLAIHYATDTPTAASAASVLGFVFQGGNGLTSSVNLATHYFGLSVKHDASPFSAGLVEYHYADCLVLQAEKLYPFLITGFNVLPRVAFWLEKSANAGQPPAKLSLKKLKANETGKCSACNASEASSGKKFLRCGRCKLYCYCSKKCQRESWNAGHKVDCKSVYC